jgi:hypothetical protein
MIIAAAVVFVIVGVAMILFRHYLARVQALFAGGTIVPGCVVAEAIVFFILAILVIVASRAGLLS